MDITSTFKKFGVILGILIVLFGLSIFIWPVKVLSIIEIVIGAAFLLAGVAGVIKVARDSNIVSGKAVKILPGILLIFLSISILVFPFSTLYMVGILIGIFALLSSFQQFVLAKVAKTTGASMTPFIVMGVVNLLFSVGMFMASISMMSFMLMFMGAYAVIYGVMLIFSSLTLKSNGF